MNSPTIIQAMQTIFRANFRDLKTWGNWQVFLKVLFGLPLNEHELPLAGQCTGREEFPTQPFRSCYVPAGRRAGKSLMAAYIAVYKAIQDYSHCLARGERGTVLCLAQDRKAAGIVFNYIRSFLRADPVVPSMIERETTDSIELSNMITLQVGTSSFRSVRGLTCVCIIADEIAYWQDPEGSRNPAAEVLRSLRPSLLTIPDSLFLAISSTYSQEGVLYDAVEAHFGKDESETLVWRAPTILMNPTASQESISKEIAQDPGAYYEYQAEFRPGMEGYISESSLRNCVVVGRVELLPNPMFRYTAFADLAGGTGQDSAALAIGHREDDIIVLDCIHAWPPPFDPLVVVEEMARLSYAVYGVRTIQGDRFSGGIMPSAFSRHQVTYDSDKVPDKSLIYAQFVPLVMACQVELLDDPDLMRELQSLVRRNRAGGAFTIDHLQGRHDDIANVCCGVCVLLEAQKGHIDLVYQGMM
jgi:hypothetical protein